MPAPSWSAAIAAWSWYGPGSPHPERPLDERGALLDPGAVPATPILVVEEDELAVGADAGLAARIVQEHQGQQAERLGLVRHQPDQDAAEPDRLRAQLAPDERLARRRVVALVEDQVQDLQDPVEALGQEVVRRDSIGDAGVADLPLRAHEPLGERRLGHEEGPRDLRRLSPPRVRSVRATRASSGRAGWQQVKIRRSRSSSVGIGFLVSRLLGRQLLLDELLPPRPLGLLDQRAFAGGAGRWPGCGRWS